MPASMITNRLQLALERLAPSDWGRFEQLAAVFLAAEFAGLRTTATPSGDEGRDSELFSPEAEPAVVLQYSVAVDWRDKIRRTSKRLEKTHPKASVLIYVSNQTIGADADDLKRTLRTERGLTLDVRDRHWFTDRVLGHPAREKAAEELAQVIVDPYLASKDVQPRVPSDLSTPEVVAGLTYLGLQWRDDVRDKGLTRLAFEALVRAALAKTDSQHRMSREAVRRSVLRLLPDHSPSQVNTYVNAALTRLTKHAIRHWTKEDEFCLSFEEHQRVTDFLTCAAMAESALATSIKGMARAVLEARHAPLNHQNVLADSIRRVVDAILFSRSQSFAIAIQTGSLASFASDDFKDALIAEVGRGALPKTSGVDWLHVLDSGVREALASDDPAVVAHLRSLADAYTLLAFLRQTPDVQGAVEKMFSHGEIWLDTTIVLPLLAESLDEGSPGRFTRMIRAAAEAGLELRVTGGVLEEIERHMNRAASCSRTFHTGWIGRVPYLLEQYVTSGQPLSAFELWLETYRGSARPMEDIADYLAESFRIQRRDLSDEANEASPELRYALEEWWRSVHERRRGGQAIPIDQTVLTRLVRHDVECYCGVTQLRKSERSSPFGYSAWWLTIDKHAFNLKSKLAQTMKEKPPDSPVLGADFLVNYLAFGPIRGRVAKTTESHLPLIMDEGAVRFLTPELMAEAEAFRESVKDLPVRVQRRRVRDFLDAARRRIGRIAEAGVDEPADESIAT